MANGTNIQETIRDAVTHSGKTIPSIAKEAGVSQASLYQYLKGERDLRTTTMEKILRVLGLTLTN